jgi:hypothetical protein
MGAREQEQGRNWCDTCASILASLESEALDPSTPTGGQRLLAHTIEHAKEAGQIPRSVHGELIVAISTTSEGGISLVIQEEPPVPAAVRRQAEMAFSRVTKAPKAQSFSLYVMRY